MLVLHGPLPHRLLLAIAVLGWFVAIGGLVYARLFVSDVVAPKAVMSAQTFTGVFAIGVGLLVAALGFVGSLVLLLFSSQQSGTLLLAVAISGVYALPSTALLIYASYFK